MFRVYNCNAKSNLKYRMYKEKQEKFAVGTVHYENPLIDQFVEIDQFGCAFRSQSPINRNCAQKLSLQQEFVEICGQVSKESTKEEVTISNGKVADIVFTDHKQKQSALLLNPTMPNKATNQKQTTDKPIISSARGKIKKQSKPPKQKPSSSMRRITRLDAAPGRLRRRNK